MTHVAKWLLLFTLLQACSVVRTQGNPDVVQNQCHDDSECGSGVCDPSQFVCVARSANTEIVFEGSPPNRVATASATTTTLDPRTISSQGAVNLSLKPPVSVQGLISAPIAGTNMRTSPLAASVRFRRQGAPAQESLTRVLSASTAQPQLDGTSVNFAAQLVAGTYDVTVTPDEQSDLPPYLIYDLEVPPAGSANRLVLNVLYATPIVVSGRVVDAESGAPLKNVAVRLADTLHDRSTISTIATTGNDGAFSLKLSPNNPDAWALELSSADESATSIATGRLIYQVEKSVLDTTLGYTSILVSVPHSAARALAENNTCPDCVELNGTVEGQSASGTTVTVSNATLSMRAENVVGSLPIGHTTWFESLVTTASDGAYHVRVLPGTHAVVITTELDGFAITETSLTVGTLAQQNGRVLNVARKIPLSGEIVSELQGTPLMNATVELVPVPLRSTEQIATVQGTVSLRATQLARGVISHSDLNGHFEAMVDPGYYRVVVRPVTGSGHAPFVHPNVVEAGRREAGLDPLTPVPVTLGTLLSPPPVYVQGWVTDSTSVRVPVAGVRAFARVRLPLTGSYDVELADVVADGDGHYSMLLPSVTQR